MKLSTNKNNKFKWILKYYLLLLKLADINWVFVLPTGTHIFLISAIHLAHTERQTFMFLK